MQANVERKHYTRQDVIDWAKREIAHPTLIINTGYELSINGCVGEIRNVTSEYTYGILYDVALVVLESLGEQVTA